MPRSHRFRPVKKHILACAILFLLFRGSAVLAAPMGSGETLEDQRAMAVQSNETPNWPIGPAVSARSAILMEAETGTILYAKNIHQREYPASITKILTCLIASEQCSLDEVVTFSHDAIFDTPRDSNHIAMDVGQQLTMEQCLNAILIRSANEVSYAVAEHLSGTTDWSVFAETMNRRARELGALNTNFVNPNGLPDEDHYSTAYDLAMIGRAFFNNEMLCQITLTRRLDIPASDTVPERKLEINNMQIIPGGTYAYEYLVGCKTGYTESARSCLASCAEKDGMKLICVVMRDENPLQYEDTISLFNYGFSNFEKVNVAKSDTRYHLNDSDMFYGGSDIFGSSRALLTLNKDDTIILPRTAALADVETTISYETENAAQAAVITYSYHGVRLGAVRVNFAADDSAAGLFDPSETEGANRKKTGSFVIFINILRVAIALGILGAVTFLLTLFRIISKHYAFSFGGKRRAWRRDSRRRRKSRKKSGPSIDFKD